MRLLVVGGRLQGTEAVYLAAKAGWETVLVDRCEAPPAAALADRHIVTDIVADESRTRALVTACDAVLPACEDLRTLEWLAARVSAWGVPLLFDLDAYRVSESKLASQRLFEELDVPRPLPWPTCGLPAVVKPDSASGSEGVSVVHDEAGLSAALARLAAAGHEPMVEEYVAGPSLSLEVLAWNGHAVPLQVTGLVTIQVADLPGGLLGEAVGKTILIDRNAAGYGWFVDPTPALDEEFTSTGNGQQLRAVDPRAVDRIDLLTVVEHELGHIAGLKDLNVLTDELMSGMLGIGVRRNPSYQDTIDATLAS